jgi:hypothetical protein
MLKVRQAAAIERIEPRDPGFDLRIYYRLGSNNPAIAVQGNNWLGSALLGTGPSPDLSARPFSDGCRLLFPVVWVPKK